MAVVLALAGFATPASEAGTPQGQIIAPEPGAKLWARDSIALRISVNASASATWRVFAVDLDSEEENPIASGSGAISGRVADIHAESFAMGHQYRLILEVDDGASAARAESSFRVADPRYALIPLEAGNLTREARLSYSVDGSGEHVLHAAELSDPQKLLVRNRVTGAGRYVSVDAGSNEGISFTRDGARVFFKGVVKVGHSFISGIGYLDLSSEQSILAAQGGLNLFTASATGQQVAYQLSLGSERQFFFFDGDRNLVRQLTDQPGAVDLNAGCPRPPRGTRPLISADGKRVVMISSALLAGGVPDPEIGCRVFVYDAETDAIDEVGTFHRPIVLGLPSLSDDARWLSVLVSKPNELGATRVSAGLLDLGTGEFLDPAVDLGDSVAFDSVVSGDGQALIFSSQADLDQSVGNADHNLELFRLDREGRTVEQITDTIGGIDLSPNGCAPYSPVVDRAGNVAVFSAVAGSETCASSQRQRTSRAGLAFRLARAVPRRTGNSPPIFDGIAERIRRPAGTHVVLDIAAHDPDGDPISLFAQVAGGVDVPAGAEMIDHYDGTGAFRWWTNLQDVGEHTIRFAAFDEGGDEVVANVTLILKAPGDICFGDCNDDLQVTVDEVVSLVARSHGGGRQCGLAPEADLDDFRTAITNVLQQCEPD